MQPHKHAEVIKAWADGVRCQWRIDDRDGWSDLLTPEESRQAPLFFVEDQYRIKPHATDEQTDDSTGIVEVSE